MGDVDPALGEQVFDVPQAGGYFTYSITASRMISGDVLK